MRRLLVIHRVGAAGKDDAFVLPRADGFQRRGIGQDLRVNVMIAHAAGDQLVILTAEVQH